MITQQTRLPRRPMFLLDAIPFAFLDCRCLYKDDKRCGDGGWKASPILLRLHPSSPERLPGFTLSMLRSSRLAVGQTKSRGDIAGQSLSDRLGCCAMV